MSITTYVDDIAYLKISLEEFSIGQSFFFSNDRPRVFLVI
jgi:hypothetical protein